jgi:hypothetical protein
MIVVSRVTVVEVVLLDAAEDFEHVEIGTGTLWPLLVLWTLCGRLVKAQAETRLFVCIQCDRDRHVGSTRDCDIL